MKIFKRVIKYILVIVIGLIILIIIGNTIYNQMGNCRVEGIIKGLGTRLAFVSGGSTSTDYTFFKVILILNDKFAFNVNHNNEGGGRILTQNMFFDRANGESLLMRSKRIDYEINPNESIHITGELQEFTINYLITGNKMSEQASQFRSNNLDNLKRETQLSLKIDSLKFANAPKELIDSLSLIFDKTREDYTLLRLQYVIQNPSHEISAKYLSYQHIDSIVKYLPLLTDNVLKTDDGKILVERNIAYGKTKTGSIAPNVSGMTPNNTAFNLSDLRGKYVVLDFWGSWCTWCIKGFPKMKDYYERYKSEIEFVSIACRDNRDDWQKSIKENNLNWIQLIDNDSINISLRFNIEAYPTKILIDKEGKIVEKFVGESDLFYIRVDSLFLKQLSVSHKSTLKN